MSVPLFVYLLCVSLCMCDPLSVTLPLSLSLSEKSKLHLVISGVWTDLAESRRISARSPLCFLVAPYGCSVNDYD